MNDPTEREAIAQIIRDVSEPSASCLPIADRIIAKHILPLRQDVARLRVLEEDFREKVWANAAVSETRASALEAKLVTQVVSLTDTHHALLAAEALLAECETVLSNLLAENGPQTWEKTLEDTRALLAKLKARTS